MIDSKYTQYARDVLSGRIVAGNLIKLACQRYLSFMERSDIEFLPEKAERVIYFISHIKHYSGKTAGQSFMLEEWQKWIIYNIFGFYWKGTNLRVCHKVLLTIARKNGKSAFASAISLYCLIADGEMGAQILNVANSSKQANLLFDMSCNFCKSLAKGKKYFKVMRDKIKFDKMKSYAQVLASDSSGLDGLSASVFICDETHEFKDSKLWDVLQSSQGFRDNPLAINISTSGFNIQGFLYKYRQTCIDILNNIKEDDSQFTAIYELDENDSWDDENVWEKSNPNLGVTVSKKYLREQINSAKNNAALEVGVRTKNLNQWVQSKEVWIQDKYLTDAMQPIDLHDYKDMFCYGGLDLSAVSDLTAFSICIPVDGKFVFKTWAFLPEAALDESVNGELYKFLVKNGELILTPGNTVDYDFVLNKILEINNIVPINNIYLDKWNATQFQINAQEAGLNIEGFSQALGSFNGPTKNFEICLKKNMFMIDKSDVVRWNFGNASLKVDFNENVKPIKDSKEKKIDCVISMIQAFAACIQTINFNNEIITLQY